MSAHERVHDRFERCVDAAPDAPALRWRGGALTYAQLDARANALAHRLRVLGVARESRVGVALRRDDGLIVALLAVLKAGACYVPLDPGYPVERLAFMLADADCALVLADTATAVRLAAHGVAARAFDPADTAIAAPPARLHSDGDSRDLAYVIYTSGSTGRPKGVAIEHRNTLALLDWARARFSAFELGGMLACTSICFDLSVFEIFAPLCSGGRVLLADDALDLADLAFRDDVRFVNTVPSAMRELLRLDALPAGVVTVCLAGEPFPADLARALARQPGVRRIVNAYGPTEDTTYSTWAEFDPDTDAAPPIGRPLPGSYARILDDALAPCAPGDAGELFLGGAGLARGYLNRPELTAERFVRDLYSDDPAARLYRTGDRVRERPDGQLDYIGRLDDQIKLRGYRIELGEIERALGSLPDAGECAAHVVDGPGGDRRLAAYYTGAADAEALKRGLAARLPSFMLPSILVHLCEMPRTLNGKRDRQRLPAPDWNRAGAAQETPHGATEQIVARLWREELGLAAIGRSERFLALGGHSLIATRIVARLRDTFGRAFGLAEFFDHPTIAACAARLDVAPPRIASAVVTAVDDTAPLTAAQKPMWALARIDPADTSYNQACLIRIAGTTTPQRLARAWREVVAAQPALRSAIVECDGAPLQRIVDGASAELSFEDVAGASDADLARRGLALAEAPFDLAAAPLVRARLYRVGANDHALAVVAHHAVFDEWSLAMLVRQLAAAHASPGALAIATPRFVDYCAHRDAADCTDALRRVRAEFAGIAPRLNLPADRPRTPARVTRGGVATLTFDDDALHAIATLARRGDATEYMILLAAFQRLVHELGGATRFVTLTAASGRADPGTQDLVGCFINMVPVRADIEPDDTFARLLARVRERSLAALEREDVPFDRVAGAAKAPGAAFGEVAFGLQTAPLARADDGGIAWRGEELRNDAARLDLSLWIDRRDGARQAQWSYRTDLYDAATIARFHMRYADILRRAAGAPDAAFDAPRRPAPRGPMNPTAPRTLAAGKLAPRTIGQGDLVAFEHRWLGGALPTRIVARLPGLDLAEWTRANRARIAQELAGAGGVLLRGFRVEHAADFRAFAQAVSSHLIHYGERSSPRTEIVDGVYTSTDHPPDQPIVLHNEQSYTTNWPMRIAFFCARPALERGRTPIADSRRILARLSDATVRRFERLGVMYVRNYLDGISLPWTVAFQTDDRAAVEAYCRSVDVAVEWVDGDRLRTRQVRPAVRTHPTTGERTWFNHALFFHVTSLPPDIARSLRASLPEADLPYNTYFGDGSPIDDDTIAELRAAFEAETVSFAWQRGDVLLLDNMLCAHGREPFVGPREVQAAMVDPVASLEPAAAAATVRP